MEKELIKDLTVHLLACISLLEQYHEKITPSKRNALYKTMIMDYKKAAQKGREYWKDNINE